MPYGHKNGFLFRKRFILFHNMWYYLIPKTIKKLIFYVTFYKMFYTSILPEAAYS